MQRPCYRVHAGRKRLIIPGTSLTLHPAQKPCLPALLLCLYLLGTYTAVQYLKVVRQREADLADIALTPESITGSTDWQSQAWPTDHGQGIPQGDASSLPVDRSMQQPRDRDMEQDIAALFTSVQDLKQKLYGHNAASKIRGKHDLATAAAEVDR